MYRKGQQSCGRDGMFSDLLRAIQQAAVPASRRAGQPDKASLPQVTLNTVDIIMPSLMLLLFSRQLAAAFPLQCGQGHRGLGGWLLPLACPCSILPVMRLASRSCSGLQGSCSPPPPPASVCQPPRGPALSPAPCPQFHPSAPWGRHRC